MTRFGRVLLTGGTGFVGGHLLAALAKRLPMARVVYLCRPGERPPQPESDFLVADLTDEDSVDAAVETVRPDLVLHLAAQASVDHAIGGADQTWRVNFCGTMWLASAIARHSPEATFFFVSSAEVYGANLRAGPAREDTPLMPLNPYAHSKAAAEAMLADVLPPGARLIIARSFNHTGAGQDERFVLPSFAAQISRMEAGQQEPCLKVGNLSAERDFMAVEDVVEAYMRLIEAPNLPPRAVFNVASGEAHSIHSLLDRMRSLARIPLDVVVDPGRLRPAEIACAVGDPSKLRAATGWAPRHSVDQMLSGLLESWRMKLEKVDPG
ncbi:MAG: GDP-mannose 4,6-dehydratase [Beijerinckiaceae bacterium]